ncbi:MAG: LCP family protein [Tissierellia bacterium]|nr:LCP family protein [Tissierellia bacterium]
MKKFFTGLLVTLIVIVLLYFGSIYYFLSQAHIGASDITDEWKSDEHILRVLVVGLDHSETQGQNVRTDTIMLMQLDYKSGKVSLLSIPRDTYVYLSAVNHMDKINHAFRYGGIETTKAVVSEILNIEIPYYVVVGYDMAREAVDLVGGVEVDVPIDMVYEDPTADPPLYINLEKGLQILDGKKALQYLRFRKGYGNQDLGRINAQQVFVQSFMHELTKPVNLLKVPLMVKSYTDNVNTNLPLSKLIKFAAKIRLYNFNDMELATLPGIPNERNGISYYDVNADELLELANKLYR